MRQLQLTFVAAALTLLCAASAHAAPVLVLDGHKTTTRHERFAGQTELAPPWGVHGPLSTVHKSTAPAPKGRATRTALGSLGDTTHLAILKRALRAYKTLTGTRKTELGAVIDNVDAISAAGALTQSRLTPVFDTLDANRQWWTTGPLLANGRRVSFKGSQLIWQYYGGQGIELQMLANFGKANALWADHDESALRQLMDELVPLAADRGGFPAWEYYFVFGGGKPPWSSGISQGTAVQSLGRASDMLGDPALRDLATNALALFEQPPPAGVRSATPNGAFYLIYTFAPDMKVINAHLQAVIGLYDFAQLTGDPRAQALFQAGDAEARASLPQYDTGKWSLYDLTHESDLSYHRLTTTFLKNLCSRLGVAIYCDEAQKFKAYEKVPPAVNANTSRIRTGAPARLGFALDKISRVGVTVSQNGRTVFATSAIVGRGTHYYTWSKPAAKGSYELRVTATDLNGNKSEPSERPLTILAARKKRGQSSATGRK